MSKHSFIRKNKIPEKAFYGPILKLSWINGKPYSTEEEVAKTPNPKENDIPTENKQTR